MNTVLSELGRAIGAEQKGSSSQYVTIEAKNGNQVTIRLSDHNASVERMDNAGKDNAISIVISRKGNKGIQGAGEARMVEYYYSDKKLRQAGGKAVAAIARSLQQTLYSGEFKDTTGLADVDVKNADMKIEVLPHPARGGVRIHGGREDIPRPADSQGGHADTRVRPPVGERAAGG